ncbi:hypothetical protein BD769DRAFT_855471 [Suillus cothurnatus]|nr:hypothetical protein BD769DRAFT_855471 [Suillus cothurnatus]
MSNASAFVVAIKFSASSAIVAPTSEESASVFCERRSTAVIRFPTSIVIDARVVLTSEERVSVVCARRSTVVIRVSTSCFPPKLCITCSANVIVS